VGEAMFVCLKIVEDAIIVPMTLRATANCAWHVKQLQGFMWAYNATYPMLRNLKVSLGKGN